MPANQPDPVAEQRLADLRRTRQRRVDQMLHDDLVTQAPGNAAYWIVVVAGSFVLNLLLLIAIAR